MKLFATQWITDWNAHDVDKILSHYAPDVVFHSPKVALFTKSVQTHFTSREQLRPYFSFAFKWRPNLHFELLSVCQDGEGIAIVYKDDTGATAVEIMDLNVQGQVTFARVMYDR
jgi:predicted ester cyclase